MSAIKEQLKEVARILEEHDLDIIQHEDETFSLLDKNGHDFITEIADFDVLHSTLLGFEEGYAAAVKFYRVAKH